MAESPKPPASNEPDMDSLPPDYGPMGGELMKDRLQRRLAVASEKDRPALVKAIRYLEEALGV